MKYFLSLLLTFAFYISFGQITLLEIQKVYKMNFDQFEAFAISKGFDFHEFRNDENRNGISYVKGVKNGTKYLMLYDKFFVLGKYVTYQTCNTSEILNLKTQLKNSGFKNHNSFFNDRGTKVEEYRNNLFEFDLYTVPPGKYTWVTYEVSYFKISE